MGGKLVRSSIEFLCYIWPMMFKEGDAVVDLKHKEVFIYCHNVDGKTVTDWPKLFRAASEEEERMLKESGLNYMSLDGALG